MHINDQRALGIPAGLNENHSILIELHFGFEKHFKHCVGWIRNKDWIYFISAGNRLQTSSHFAFSMDIFHLIWNICVELVCWVALEWQGGEGGGYSFAGNIANGAYFRLKLFNAMISDVE